MSVVDHGSSVRSEQISQPRDTNPATTNKNDNDNNSSYFSSTYYMPDTAIYTIYITLSIITKNC